MNFFARVSFKSDHEAAVYKRVAWRLIPFLLVLYIISFLDRVNVGFAKLQMSADIGLSEAVFGLGPASSSSVMRPQDSEQPSIAAVRCSVLDRLAFW